MEGDYFRSTDIVQTAYQIIVSDKDKGIENESNPIWDSGIISSNGTVNIEYKGKTLESNKIIIGKLKFGLIPKLYTQ